MGIPSIIPPAITTLEQARLYVRHNVRRGVRCPCCEGVVKLHPRKISTVAAQGLILACRYIDESTDGKGGWLALGDFFTAMHRRGVIIGKPSGGDYAKLRFFGLIDPKKPPKLGATRVGNGKWGVTQLCRDFVYNKVTIPKVAYIYKNELIAVDDAHMSIVDVVGEEIYTKLMQLEVSWKQWDQGTLQGATP